MPNAIVSIISILNLNLFTWQFEHRYNYDDAAFLLATGLFSVEILVK